MARGGGGGRGIEGERGEGEEGSAVLYFFLKSGEAESCCQLPYTLASIRSASHLHSGGQRALCRPSVVLFLRVAQLLMNADKRSGRALALTPPPPSRSAASSLRRADMRGRSSACTRSSRSLAEVAAVGKSKGRGEMYLRENWRCRTHGAWRAARTAGDPRDDALRGLVEDPHGAVELACGLAQHAVEGFRALLHLLVRSGEAPHEGLELAAGGVRERGTGGGSVSAQYVSFQVRGWSLPETIGELRSRPTRRTHRCARRREAS